MYKIKKNALEEELLSVYEEEKNSLIAERDKLNTIIIENAEQGKKRFDSILNIEPEIKYIRYEKTVYSDRTVDENLTILEK